MLTKEDIEHLAVLARITVSPVEQESIAKDLDAVLGYVSEVSQVATDADAVPRVGAVKNIMRDDVDAHVGGEFTDAIMSDAPHTEDGYLKVKQIL